MYPSQGHFYSTWVAFRDFIDLNKGCKFIDLCVKSDY